MRENTPVRRSKPLPNNYPVISADGFVPVPVSFGENGCGCENRCAEVNNTCGCCERECDSCNACSARNNACCDNGCAAEVNNTCGCCEQECDSCNACSARNNACCDNGCAAEVNNTCGCCERECDSCNACSVRNNACCDNGCTAEVNNTCGCCEQECDSCNCQNAGMVYAAHHSLNKRFSAAEGIRQGTLFRELHKPFAACAQPGGCANITDMQELAFAAWELRLYLNTHPCDRAALKLFEEYECKLRQANYATSFVEGCSGRNRWNWIDDPWPWETCANKGRS